MENKAKGEQGKPSEVEESMSSLTSQEERTSKRRERLLLELNSEARRKNIDAEVVDEMLSSIKREHEQAGAARYPDGLFSVTVKGKRLTFGRSFVTDYFGDGGIRGSHYEVSLGRRIDDTMVSDAAIDKVLDRYEKILVILSEIYEAENFAARSVRDERRSDDEYRDAKTGKNDAIIEDLL